ncbi:MAG: IS630 transposase-related protein [Bdellovibrionales bacterium]
MTYSLSHRQAAISFIEGGGSKVEASRIFKVSRDTLYRLAFLLFVFSCPRMCLRPRPAEARRA